MLAKEQAGKVLAAIRSVYPDYEAEVYIEKEPPDISPLVRPFYKDLRIDMKDFTPNKNKLLLKDTMKMFEEQLERERLGFYSIQSVDRKDQKLSERSRPSDQQTVQSFSEIQLKWKEDLASAIEKEIELVKSDKKGIV